MTVPADVLALLAELRSTEGMLRRARVIGRMWTAVRSLDGEERKELGIALAQRFSPQIADRLEAGGTVESPELLNMIRSLGRVDAEEIDALMDEIGDPEALAALRAEAFESLQDDLADANLGELIDDDERRTALLAAAATGLAQDLGIVEEEPADGDDPIAGEPEDPPVDDLDPAGAVGPIGDDQVRAAEFAAPATAEREPAHPADEIPTPPSSAEPPAAAAPTGGELPDIEGLEDGVSADDVPEDDVLEDDAPEDDTPAAPEDVAPDDSSPADDAGPAPELVDASQEVEDATVDDLGIAVGAEVEEGDEASDVGDRSAPLAAVDVGQPLAETFVARLRQTDSPIVRLRIIRSLPVDTFDTDLLAVLHLIPDGWQRRRAVDAVLEMRRRSVADAAAIIAVLGRVMDRRWSTSRMRHHWELSDAEAAQLAEVTGVGRHRSRLPSA